MRVIRMLFVSVLTLAILVACSENDTKETSKKEDTTDEQISKSESTDSSKDKKEDSELTAIKDKSEDIKSYHTDMDMTANLDDTENEELNAEVDYIIEDPPSIELTSFDTLRMVSVDGKTYFNNDEEWVDISDSVELDALFHVTYQNAVQYFSDIYSDLKRVDEDNTVKYVYEGNDGFIYNGLEEYLAVNFGTVDTSNHNTKIEFTVDDKNHVIKEIEFKSDIKDDTGGIVLEGDIHYSEFDNIESITLPEM